jgi:hypothetical protein
MYLDIMYRESRYVVKAMYLENQNNLQLEKEGVENIPTAYLEIELSLIQR